MHRLFMPTILALALTACGGGSSTSANSGSGISPDIGTDTPTLPVNDSGLAFSPAKLTASAIAGQSVDMVVTATATKTFSGTVNVAIIDSTGVFSTDVGLTQKSPYQYVATLHLASRLPAGVYDGSLKVRLCKDEPQRCADPYPGSPWLLPYHVEVKAFVSGTPSALSVNTDMPDWLSYQGNAMHTGYVPTSINVAKIAPRFSWQPPVATDKISEAVSQAGLTYVSAGHSIYAIDEQTGLTKWKTRVPDISQYFSDITAPTLDGNRLYVAQDDPDRSMMRTLDRNSGELIASVITSARPGFGAPTADKDAVYVAYNGGGVAGLNAAGQIVGSRLEIPSSNWFVSFTPLLAVDYGYFYKSGILARFNKSTGKIVSQIASQTAQQGHYYQDTAAPVMLSSQQVLVVERNTNSSDLNSLTNFDFSTQSVKWKLAGRFSVAPVVTRGAVYVAEDDKITALNGNSGSALWTWSIPTASQSSNYMPNLIVTDNLLFASFGKNVYAIDLKTHQTVWSYGVGGCISLSRNGVLYVGTPTSLLYAFNTR